MFAKSRNLQWSIVLLAASLTVVGCQKEYSVTAPKYSAPVGSNEFTATFPGDLSGRKIESGGKCSMDTVNKVNAAAATKVELNTDLYLSGWAVDDASSSIGKSLLIELRDAKGKKSYYAATTTRGPRPDVAEALKNKKYENSGFVLAAIGKGVDAGNYGIRILIVNNESIVNCDTEKKFVFEK